MLQFANRTAVDKTIIKKLKGKEKSFEASWSAGEKMIFDSMGTEWIMAGLVDTFYAFHAHSDFPGHQNKKLKGHSLYPEKNRINQKVY